VQQRLATGQGSAATLDNPRLRRKIPPQADQFLRQIGIILGINDAERYRGGAMLRRCACNFCRRQARACSWWVHFVAPIPAAIARPLIDGLRSESKCRN
jgi:hypothetical protein